MRKGEGGTIESLDTSVHRQSAGEIPRMCCAEVDRRQQERIIKPAIGALATVIASCHG